MEMHSYEALLAADADLQIHDAPDPAPPPVKG
jgi:hypothetical protein